MRHAARDGVGVAAVGAEAEIAGLHGRGATGGDGFLAERKVAGALHQALQKQVVGALLRFANLHLQTVKAEPECFTDLFLCHYDGGRGSLGDGICHDKTLKQRIVPELHIAP